MLNFNEFQEHIKNTILDYLPEEFSDAKVDLQQVAKNNETLTGIIIHQEKVNISPTIYLDPFYKEYIFARHEIYRADQEQQRQAELNAEQARTHATGR